MYIAPEIEGMTLNTVGSWGHGYVFFEEGAGMPRSQQRDTSGLTMVLQGIPGKSSDMDPL